jgi:hypothetical protein
MPIWITENSSRARASWDQDAPELTVLLNEIIRRGGTTAWEELFTADSLAKTMLIGPDVISCFVALSAQTGKLLGFHSLLRIHDGLPTICDITTFVRIGQAKKGISSSLFAATIVEAGKNDFIAINATIRADNSGGLRSLSQFMG